MKTLIVLTIAVVLLLIPATVAVADAAGGSPAVPAHGSVWFGSGLEVLAPVDAAPLHGSVWFGSGLERYAAQSTPINAHDMAMIRRGAAQNGTALHSSGAAVSPENSFDVAMIRRGATHDQITAESPNSFDTAMLQRGPVRGWMAQRSIVQVTH